MNSLRRIAIAAVAVFAVVAAFASTASADRIAVTTSVSVPAPYDQTALLNQRTVDGSKGPVLLQVHNRIECLRGSVRRSGYPAMCQWHSGLFGVNAVVGTQQGTGDVYAANSGTYPLGTTFHAGTLRQDRVADDYWPLIARHKDPSQPAKVFKLAVEATSASGFVSTFVIR
jgi:hypothetical protein